MPLELLREIAEGTLPRRISDETQIDKVRVLAAAGMVIAELPDPDSSDSALVLTLTGLGRASLKIRTPPPLPGIEND